MAFEPKWAAINYVDKQWERAGLGAIHLSTLLNNLSNKGEGVKNPINPVIVVYGCPKRLMEFRRTNLI